jgi:hypothetical protein
MVQEGRKSSHNPNALQGNIVTCNDKMLQILDLVSWCPR